MNQLSNRNNKYDLEERLAKFAEDIIDLVRTIKTDAVNKRSILTFVLLVIVAGGELKLLAFGRFFAKSNISQRESNYKEGEKYQRQNISIPKSHDNLLLDQYANSNDNIPATTSNVNTTVLEVASTPGNIGPTIATPNQNTEKSIKKSAITDSRTESFFGIYSNINIDTYTFQSKKQFNNLAI